MAASRPVVSVYDAQTGNNVGSVAQPAVFTAPIRNDIVQFVHTNMRKNKRQAYAVAFEAGHQTSAISWGTGRAVSRIPRVNGGGTHRAGQGAFGNMCRSGRMFGPTRQWRRWNRHVNLNQRRYATVSALAASAVSTLVMARGHAVGSVKEFPLVVDNLEGISKTKEAVAVLKALGANEDLERVEASKKVRAGKGKARNRRYTQRVGPLVVYAEDNGLTRAFRNLPGVECQDVNTLNLLQLAPGGHVGRFIIWTKGAFERLEALYGSYNEGSTEKSGYTLPRTVMTTADLSRVINSAEVQAVVRPLMKQARVTGRKKNPLKNWQTMVKLNPYAIVQRRQQLRGDKVGIKRAKPSREEIKTRKAASKAFYQTMVTDEYVAPADIAGAGAGAGAGAA